MTYSEVEEVSGYVGNFKVKVAQEGPLRRHDKCTGCAPVRRSARPQGAERVRPGARQAQGHLHPVPAGGAQRAVIDAENCLTLKGKKCKQPCTTACGPQAIDFEQQDQVVEVEVGAIILATGFQLFDATPETALRLRAARQRLTSLEFERLTNAAGPTGGESSSRTARRPERGHPPLRRQPRREPPRVLLARLLHVLAQVRPPHQGELPDTEVYKFYIDMRCSEGLRGVLQAAPGRGRALHPRPGRRGQRRAPWRPKRRGSSSSRPRTRCSASCGASRSTWSSSPRPRRRPRTPRQVAQTFASAARANGFFLEQHPKLAPVTTATDGIFIAGGCQGPKDIPDTVAQAGAAAAGALALVDNPHRQGGADHLVHRRRSAPAAASASASARTPPSSSTRRRTSPRSSTPPARAAACASPPAAQRAAAARLPRRADLRRDRRGDGPLGRRP